MANAECFRRVLKIITDEMKRNPGERVAVVVSAMGGKPKVTDMLLSLAKTAQHAATCEAYAPQLDALRARHMDLVAAVLPEADAAPLGDFIDALLAELRVILAAVRLTRRCDPQLLQMISGYGELCT